VSEQRNSKQNRPAVTLLRVVQQCSAVGKKREREEGGDEQKRTLDADETRRKKEEVQLLPTLAFLVRVRVGAAALVLMSRISYVPDSGKEYESLTDIHVNRSEVDVWKAGGEIDAQRGTPNGSVEWKLEYRAGSGLNHCSHDFGCILPQIRLQVPALIVVSTSSRSCWSLCSHSLLASVLHICIRTQRFSTKRHTISRSVMGHN
jgi:hypothetical protein